MARAKPAIRPAREQAVFPAPGHDHARCSTDAMTEAEARCVARGQRLTPMRREVLAALLVSHRPLGAYEIMERLAPRGPRPAPITVYRALEFLRERSEERRVGKECRPRATQYR